LLQSLLCSILTIEIAGVTDHTHCHEQVYCENAHPASGGGTVTQKNSSARPVAWWFLLSQAIVFGGFLVAFLLTPHSLNANEGLSFFGVTARTLIPYGVSLTAGAVSLVLVSRTLKVHHHLEPIPRSLTILAIVLPFEILTPFRLSSTFSVLHEVVSTVVFSLEFVTAYWIVSHALDSRTSKYLLAVMFIAGIGAWLGTKQIIGFSLISQVAFQFAFSLLLLQVLHALPLSKVQTSS